MNRTTILTSLDADLAERYLREGERVHVSCWDHAEAIALRAWFEAKGVPTEGLTTDWLVWKDAA